MLPRNDPTAPRLSADQSRRLLEVHVDLEKAAPGDWPRLVTRRIAEILNAKAALIACDDRVWFLLGESGPEPPLPSLNQAFAARLDRVAAGRTSLVARLTDRGRTWTLVGPTEARGEARFLVLDGDWTSDELTLAELPARFAMAEQVSWLSRQAHVRTATHRLGRRLGRAAGLKAVSEAVVRVAAQTVGARIASIALAHPDGSHLSIAATFGYQHALVEHLRIAPGAGILGSVFTTGAPLRVRDVNTLPARTRRPRYRTDSLAAVPLSAGGEVLGVISVTDRADGLPFTRDDVSALRALAAPAVLAIGRERARRQAESFAHAAAVDPVSGLFNRRYFHVRLDEELQRARRHNISVALLMIDIDDFKNINDTYGHLAGDTVIRDTAEIVRRSVRVFDVCTRYGGEEFAIVMPGSTADAAASIAERIRQRIEEYRSAEANELHVTASVGVTVSSAHTLPRDLVLAADEALYEAKRAGKNQVRVVVRAGGASGEPPHLV